PGLVGNNPDLQKVHRLGLRRVVLAVADSSSGTHPLNITYANYRASACAVFVRQGAFEHVGDDLHVPVRVGWESGTRSHAIFIDDSEMTKAHILRIMIVPEREGMAAIEPADLCFSSFSCRSYSNHFIPLLILHLRNTLKTALMSESQDSSKTYSSSTGHVLGDQGGNCRLSQAGMEGFYTLFYLHVRCRPTRVLAQVLGPRFDKETLDEPTRRSGVAKETPAGGGMIAARLLWKIEKAYSLGIPKNKLAHGVSQAEEEH